MRTKPTHPFNKRLLRACSCQTLLSQQVSKTAMAPALRGHSLAKATGHKQLKKHLSKIISEGEKCWAAKKSGDAVVLEEGKL